VHRTCNTPAHNPSQYSQWQQRDIRAVNISGRVNSTIIHATHRWDHQSKVYLWTGPPYTALQHRNIIMSGDSTMRLTRRFLANAAAAVRSFSIELYAAHGGWAPAVRG
jgi:hypothetical protein